jgi:hypothetical protein
MVLIPLAVGDPAGGAERTAIARTPIHADGIHFVVRYRTT